MVSRTDECATRHDPTTVQLGRLAEYLIESVTEGSLSPPGKDMSDAACGVDKTSSALV